jgi:hypothetical protein
MGTVKYMPTTTAFLSYFTTAYGAIYNVNLCKDSPSDYPFGILDLRILITPLVSSNSSYLTKLSCHDCFTKYATFQYSQLSFHQTLQNKLFTSGIRQQFIAGSGESLHKLTLYIAPYAVVK